MGSLTERDIRAGLYNYAEVTASYVIFDNLSYGLMQQRFGWVGQFALSDGKFTAEIRGLTQRLAQTFGENIGPACKAAFCDERCKLNALDYTYTGIVDASSDTQHFTSGVAPDVRTDALFRDGNVTFTSGANDGVTMEVVGYTAATGSFELALAVPFEIAAGDTFSIVRGCNKQLTTCVSYGNVLNMRAEPFVPGDVLTQETPDYT